MAQLNQVVNEIMLGAKDPNNILFGTGKSLVVLIAKRSFQQLFLSALRHPKNLTVDVPESGIITPPVDYQRLIRMSVLDPNNQLLVVYYDPRMPIQYEYLRDSEQSLILDTDTGLPIKSYTNVDSSISFDISYPSDFKYGQFYGFKGGYKNGAGSYRWDEEAGVWYVKYIRGDKLFIEYLPDPLKRDDIDIIDVREDYVEVLKSLIIYNIIKNKTNVPASRIQMAKNEYTNLKKRVKIQNINMKQLIQAARTQRGSFKF